MGYEELPYNENDVLKLKKGLYGLKQSGKLWYEDLMNTLTDMEFIQSDFDGGLYFRRRGSELIFDMLVACTEIKEEELLRKGLASKYKFTRKDEISEILNMKINVNKITGITIQQERYIEEKIVKFNIEQAKDFSTPLSVIEENESELERSVPYLELLGSLGYAAKTSRPDISFAFGYLSRYSHKVTNAAWEAAKRTLKYLKKTKSYGLHYDANDKSINLTGFSDATKWI